MKDCYKKPRYQITNLYKPLKYRKALKLIEIMNANGLKEFLANYQTHMTIYPDMCDSRYEKLAFAAMKKLHEMTKNVY